MYFKIYVDYLKKKSSLTLWGVNFSLRIILGFSLLKSKPMFWVVTACLKMAF